jgi:23S rRNA (cytidine1920-2'-O)/16S rRNA (cytidine1409-2'-O)-methyltransferase
MGTKTPLKDRLDHLMVTRSLAQSRDAATRMIIAGQVTIAGMVVDKPAKMISRDTPIEIHEPATRFVSRGGEKLLAALDACAIEVQGLTCLDVGCSTGGFTDCLLQRGASRVYAIDVGYGQFDWRLRNDARVVLHERTNIRYVDASMIPEPIDLVVIDVSFISLEKVFPAITSFLRRGALVIALIKPQFEVGKGQVGRGGIVREESQRQDVLQRILGVASQFGLRTKKTLDSPLKGKKGNLEFLAIFEFSAPNCDMKEGISRH